MRSEGTPAFSHYGDLQWTSIGIGDLHWALRKAFLISLGLRKIKMDVSVSKELEVDCTLSEEYMDVFLYLLCPTVIHP